MVFKIKTFYFENDKSESVGHLEKDGFYFRSFDLINIMKHVEGHGKGKVVGIEFEDCSVEDPKDLNLKVGVEK